MGAHTAQAEALKLPLAAGPEIGVGIGPRVKLDQWGAQLGGQLDLRLVRIDEETGLDPGGVHRVHAGPNRLAAADHVQAALGRDFLAVFRDEADGLGLQLQREFRHRGGAGHLEVEASGETLAEAPHVALLDMPAVLPQVHGDAVRARALAEQGKRDRVRLHAAAGGGVGLPVARLAHGGAMVDVEAEENHGAEV